MRPIDLPQVYTPVWSAHAREQFRSRFFGCTDGEMDEYVLRPDIRQALAAGAKKLVGFYGMTIVADCGQIVTIYESGGSE